jgi:hypothetical protein
MGSTYPVAASGLRRSGSASFLALRLRCNDAKA